MKDHLPLMDKKGSVIGNTHDPTLGAASYKHTPFPPLQDADIFMSEGVHHSSS